MIEILVILGVVAVSVIFFEYLLERGFWKP